jgi:hypothetical protein
MACAVNTLPEFAGVRLSHTNTALYICFLQATFSPGSLKWLTTTMTSIHSHATLLGLPAELRLQIYAHLANSLHVHYTSLHGAWSGVWSDLSNQICPHPDPEFPQLCMRPAFSGLYLPQDTCTPPRRAYRTFDAQTVERIKFRRRQTFAIRQTCKFIYSETQGIFEATARKGVTSISIFAMAAHSVLNDLGSEILVNIRRITFERECFLPKEMRPALRWFEINQTRCVPNLEVLALQGFNWHRKFEVRRPLDQVIFVPERWRELPMVRRFEKILSPKVTIIVESWSCLGPGHRFYEGDGERFEMIIIRGVVRGQNGINDVRESTACSVRREEVVDNYSWTSHWQWCGFKYSNY